MVVHLTRLVQLRAIGWLRLVSARRRASGLCGCTRRRNAMIRAPLEPGIAHPVMSGCLKECVRGRVDLLASGGDLSESPVTFPALPGSYESCVWGCSGSDAQTAHTLVTGTASPLPIEHLQRTLARQLADVRYAISSRLLEAIIASPSLLGGAVVRMSRDIAIRLL
jgi:hypothetical protein